MKTIDWPTPLTQTYLNVDPAERVVALDDDHQAIGKHSLRLTAGQARDHAAAHRAVAEALELAADAIDGAPQDDQPPLPMPTPSSS